MSQQARVRYPIHSLPPTEIESHGPFSRMNSPDAEWFLVVDLSRESPDGLIESVEVSCCEGQNTCRLGHRASIIPLAR
ncbi:hypothetical protein [Zavarzinella formosa]|uniref:hypothetical protein n=1 Tax=Zavarzinella formosa TaxID=360055 RepID=UPI00036E9990|nr:hypothetical protein [Zavarzinella formosa]